MGCLCTKVNCNGCDHYRFDFDRMDNACHIQTDLSSKADSSTENTKAKGA